MMSSVGSWQAGEAQRKYWQQWCRPVHERRRCGLGRRYRHVLLVFAMVIDCRPGLAESIDSDSSTPTPATLASQRLFFSPQERQAQRHRSGRLSHEWQMEKEREQPEVPAETAGTAGTAGTARGEGAVQSADGHRSERVPPYRRADPMARAAADGSELTASTGNAKAGSTPDRNETTLSESVREPVSAIVYDALIEHPAGERLVVNGLPCLLPKAVNSVDESGPMVLDCVATRELATTHALTLEAGRLQIRAGERLVRELVPGESW